MATTKKRAKRANAAKTLLAEVAHDTHAVNANELRCMKAWLAEDIATRARILAELATKLDAIRTSRSYHRARGFRDMSAITTCVDRLMKARLPLDENALVKLSKFAAVRFDISVLNLATQIEHYSKTNTVSDRLRTTLLALKERYRSRDFATFRARIAAVVAPT